MVAVLVIGVEVFEIFGAARRLFQGLPGSGGDHEDRFVVDAELHGPSGQVGVAAARAVRCENNVEGTVESDQVQGVVLGPVADGVAWEPGAAGVAGEQSCVEFVECCGEPFEVSAATPPMRT